MSCVFNSARSRIWLIWTAVPSATSALGSRNTLQMLPERRQPRRVHLPCRRQLSPAAGERH